MKGDFDKVKRNVILTELLVMLMLGAMGAIVYAQVTVQIGTPNSQNDLGITTSQGYWIGQFPIILNGTTNGEAYCLTPDGTIYYGSNYVANEVPPPDNATWQGISYVLSWYAPTDTTSGAVDQVSIWDILGESLHPMLTSPSTPQLQAQQLY